MSKNLSAIRAICRQFLSDEFSPDIDLTWQDDELDLHIGHVLSEISKSSPYEVKEELTTIAGSKELDIGDIDDLLFVDEVEYPAGEDPREFRNFSVWGDTLTMDIDTAPATTGEDVYLYCAELHSLTESSSTLKPLQELLLVDGVCAYAAIAKSKDYIDKVNIGGARTAADMLVWGENKLAIYKAELRHLVKPRTRREYPKD